jgi:preprotein translocase subunit SecG
MNFLFYFTLVFFLITCVLLSFVILIQESKSMGLGASFGSDNTNSVFGTSTADVLKKFTAYMGAIFIILCVTLSLWTAAVNRPVAVSTDSMIEQPVEG